MAIKIQIRRGLASEWTSANPILALGEQGLETDTRKTKFGDGTTAWNSLSYSVDKSQIGLGNVSNVDATLRSTHTGTQVASTISDFDTAAQSAVISQNITNNDTTHAPSSDAVHDALAAEASARIAVSDRVTEIENDYGVAGGLATLDGSGKISTSMLPGTVLEYKGTWDASTNNPTLQNGSGANAQADAGHIYRVSVAGSVNFGAGSITFAVGDDVILSESLEWQRSPGGSLVISVNGFQGDVVLDSEDILLTSSVASSLNVQQALETINSAIPSAITTHEESADPHPQYLDESRGDARYYKITQVDTFLSQNSTSDRDRANHTGTQLAATISDFTTAVQAVTIDAAKIDGGVVSNGEFATLDGITTGVSIQSQINGKEPVITAATSAEYYRGDKTFQTLDKTAVGLANVDNISAANLRDRSTHTGNESTLTFSEVSTPSAPASGLTIYADSNGRQMLGQIPKAGRSYPFQPHLGQSSIQIFLPNANATTSTLLGQVAPTAGGTATTRTIATTNSFTFQKRIGYVSAATANQSSGLRSSVLQFALSNNAAAGGFFFQTRFGISDAVLVANARTFVGLTSSITAFGNADPSTLTNIIGMGHDSADTNFQIMYNDAAGSATKVDLGTNFTRSPTVSTDMYDLILYAAPNSTTVFYQVTNLRLNVVSSGSFNTNIPAVNQLLTWQHWRQNGGTAAAVGIDIASVYLETEY